MRYLSVCSGIEAASAAWEGLGWDPVAFAEIEAFPSAVLAHHYPAVPNLRDFTYIRNRWLRRIGIEPGSVGLLVGGTPCQSFSVAGLRRGLVDPRGNLALGFLQLARRLRPEWVVWENVPGVLSSTSHNAPDPSPPPPPLGVGRDGEEVETEEEYESEELHSFNCFLAGLSELGYGWAYRVLDAQHFGVPQRRRRVFVVGHLGDWRRAVAVLFERHGLSGHPPPRREAGPGVAPSVTPGARRASGQRAGELFAPVASTGPVAGGPTARYCKGPDSDVTDTLIAHTLRAEGFDASEDGTGRGTPLVPVAFDWTQAGKPSETVPTLRVGTGLGIPSGPAVAYQCHGTNVGPMGTLREGDGNVTSGVPFVPVAIQEDKQNGVSVRGDTTGSLRADAPGHQPCGTLLGVPAGAAPMAVRRLTPEECEALQGFPRGYTRIPWKGRPAEQCPDGPRYKALGNSMAVPVMRWIGERIEMVRRM